MADVFDLGGGWPYQERVTFVLIHVLRSDEKDDVYGITDAEGLGYVEGAALPWRVGGETNAVDLTFAWP